MATAIARARESHHAFVGMRSRASTSRTINPTVTFPSSPTHSRACRGKIRLIGAGGEASARSLGTLALRRGARHELDESSPRRGWAFPGETPLPSAALRPSPGAASGGTGPTASQIHLLL